MIYVNDIDIYIEYVLPYSLSTLLYTMPFIIAFPFQPSLLFSIVEITFSLVRSTSTLVLRCPLAMVHLSDIPQ